MKNLLIVLAVLFCLVSGCKGTIAKAGDYGPAESYSTCDGGVCDIARIRPRRVREYVVTEPQVQYHEAVVATVTHHPVARVATAPVRVAAATVGAVGGRAQAFAERLAARGAFHHDPAHGCAFEGIGLSSASAEAAVSNACKPRGNLVICDVGTAWSASRRAHIAVVRYCR